MKIIINRCYGGFGINPIWMEAHNLKSYDRQNPILIEAIENGEYVNDPWSDLKVVYIPDEATDWDVLEYDGMESIACVVDGKIKYIY